LNIESRVILRNLNNLNLLKCGGGIPKFPNNNPGGGDNKGLKKIF
jgi:hypothetical protein